MTALIDSAAVDGGQGPGTGVHQITCYLDFISPFAYLAFELLPEALRGLSYGVDYKPVLFGAMLKHHGQLGPAEIDAKREWTYRQVAWLAHNRGVALQMPAAHPFNPLGLLRLALACSPASQPGRPNRFVCETIFRHVWRGGADAADAARLQVLSDALAPGQDVDGDEVRAQLKSNTAEAIALGVFGVPAFVVGERVFWGLDSLPMLRDSLLGNAWFDTPEWTEAGCLPYGIQRRQATPRSAG